MKRQCSDKILDLNGRREEEFLRRLSSAMIDLIAQCVGKLIGGEPKPLSADVSIRFTMRLERIVNGVPTEHIRDKY